MSAVVVWSIFGIVVALLVIFFGIMLLTKKKHEIDYRGWFYIGIVWLAVSLLYKNSALFIMGMIFMILGIINRSKWKAQKPWKKLAKEEKRRKKIVMIVLGVLVLSGFILFLFGVRLLSGEDNWICKNGNWVKHGSPSQARPTEKCGLENESQIIGGQTDEHGCLIAAGYSYCPSKQTCLRMWEDYCEEYKDAFRGKENPELIDSFDDCIYSGYPIMESYPRQCSANNKTFTEEIK